MSKHRSKRSDKDNIVHIKPIAYYKMLIHILRFGNRFRAPRQYKEVMGMLIGHIEGEEVKDNVIIEDVVPISHGGSIEVAFAPEDYITFAKVDEDFAEKNWFTVGWYHSHPGLGFFLSGTDVLTQLGFQDVNPHAVAIVFDHKELEREIQAFEIFRLYNTSAGISSSYYIVDYELKDLGQLSELEFIEKIYYKITHLLDAKKVRKVENKAKNNIERWLKP